MLTRTGKIEIPGFVSLALEVDGGVAADLHLGREGDSQQSLRNVIQGEASHLCVPAVTSALGIEGDIQLVIGRTSCACSLQIGRSPRMPGLCREAAKKKGSKMRKSLLIIFARTGR